MKTLFTKGFYIVSAIILFVGTALPARAQFTSITLSTNALATALARDASGNIYALQVDATGTQGEVVKYTNGTGSPTVIYDGFPDNDQQGDYGTGLIVTSTGDIYFTTDNDGPTLPYGNIIKLKFNGGTSYTASVYQTGTASLGYYSGLAIDASDNIYAIQYNINADGGNSGIGAYEVVKYAAGSAAGSAGTVLYDKLDAVGLLSGDYYTPPTGITVNSLGDVYVADAFDDDGANNDGGHIYKLTKASSYAVSTVSSNQYATSLAVDASDNLYASQVITYPAYALVKYTNGTGTPTNIYTSLSSDSYDFPYGIAIINPTNIYVNDGGTNGTPDNQGNIIQLIGTPATQATNIVFTNTTATGTTASWTNGSGSSRAVFIAQASTGSPVPVNSTTYTANTTYASGTQIGGSGWYCVYNGTGSTVNITGLTSGTTYRVMAVEYNGPAGSQNYLTTGGTNNPNNITPGALTPQTITFNALPTKTYGNADFSPGATSTNSGTPAITYSSDNTAVATIVGGNIHIVSAGTANITASQAGDATHSAATSITQSLTVNQAPLTITADNQSSTYGAALPALTVSYSGFVNGDTQASLTTAATASTTATAASPAGNYVINTSGAVDPNYIISYVTGTLTIGKATLTVTADNQSSIYGAALPALTVSYSGFVNGDTQASLTTAATASTTATAASPAGNYAINTSGAVDPNYTISYVAGTLTIGKAALTVTADNQSSTYGAALPALTVSYSGFVNGDTQASLTTAATASTTATAASPAGNYVINTSGAVDPNYTISYVAGTLTIGKAALTVTADNQSSTYGAALPVLTVSYSGFVNGDTQASLTTAATASTTATAASPAGNYTITASGAVDPNYTISYVAGTLTIGKAALTITADNQSSTYGAALPALTVSYSGFVNGDTQASLTTAATAGTTATAASPAGNYAINTSGAVDPNYIISYVAGTLTIGKANLTITADNQSSTYGAALPALTVSYSGFVNGDTQASLTTAATASTTATAASPAGNYVINTSGAVDPNYIISYVTGTLTIGKATLTVTADNQSSIYGAALPALTVSYSGFVNGDTQASLTTAATASTTATAASPAGSYTINTSGAIDPNYTISYVAGTLTIGKAALTVTADNQSSTYGAALPALTVSYSGFVNGDTQASLTTAATASTTATAASPAGNYAINTSGAVDPNYTISYVAGTLTIGKAALTVTADNQSSTYGAALPALTVSYSGFVNGDTQASLTTAATASTAATAASPAGNYVINTSGAVDPNYTISYVAGTLTIGKANLTITADNQNISHGAAIPALTASYSGFVNGDNVASLTTAPTLTTTGTSASPAGSYPITASGAVNPNYNISYVAGTLTIGKALLTITVNDQNSTYGSALPTLTASYSGFVNGDNVASLATAPTISTAATAASPAGNYTITASGAVDPNYTISYVAGTLTIGKVALTVTADNQSSIYGSALPALTVSYSGFVNGDTQASLTTAATASTTATAASPAGNYLINTSGAVDPNYTISYVAGTLTIGKAALTITADNQSSIYGAALPALTVSYSGFVNGDTQASLTTAATASTTATAASPAGNYVINTSGAVDPNYIISYVTGTLTIGKATLTVTADNQSSIYGAALPALTVSYSGFVNGDTQASLTTAATASTTATAASPVGNYAINTSGAVDPNYTISYVAGTLTIGKANLTITADNQSIIHGAAIPILTASYSGFVNGDNVASLTTAPNITTTGTSASPAGSYPITASGAIDPNYNISYVAGTLSIGKAALLITVNDQTSTYGSSIPTLTVSYSGFVNGDNASSLTTAPIITTTGTASSAAGTYPINASGAADPNYTISYVAGTLTIGQAPLTITADNQTLVYGATIPVLTASYSGFVNGDNTASLTTPPTITSTGTSTSPAGTYAITASGAVDPNYAITYVAGTLSIGKAPLTITANDQTTIYGLPLPAFSVTYTGFVNGDNAASLTTAPSITTIATSTSPVGTYPITASGAIDANYAISYVAGTLTVKQAVRTLTFNALPVETYGSPDFDPGAVASDGETVLYTSSNPAAATIVNGKIHITGAGSTLITATLAANPNYTTTPTASQSLVINKANQTIGVLNIPTLIKGSHYDLSTITSSSGLPLTFTVSDPTIASVNGQTLDALLIGSTSLTVSQPGDNNYNAASTTGQIITVIDNAGDEIVVHQAVSPNGDGINDFFLIEGIKNYPDNQVTIVNRNGVKVYQTRSYDNAYRVFDGRSNITGSLQQAGTYFYLLEYTVNGESKRKTGFLVLKYQ